MSIASALGLTSGDKVRYAVVGAGDIAQEAMMPGVAHTGNSVLTALVTDDGEKARALGQRYGIEQHWGYHDFTAALASGTFDAIYLATPNWRHAEFILPALAAGIHVLTEKPLEVSADKARAILDAERASAAKLMVAYRLHFEPATLDAIRRLRAGELGEPIAFSSCFGQMLDPANHRALHGVLAGPLLDMGPYPLNAARYLYGAEPEEVVSATSVRHVESGLGDLDDTVAVTLRFPGDKLAQFTVSYYLNHVDLLTIAGTKGSITMRPAFGFGTPLEHYRTIGEKQTHESFKATDQFGGELQYFSECILTGRDPEPDAEEGMADLIVLDAIREAIATRGSVALPPFRRTRRIDPDAQERSLRAMSSPDPVHASKPGRSKG